MPSQNAINKRILDEIDNLDATQEIKSFLKEILSCELDNIDKERWSVVEKYKDAIESCFGVDNNAE